MARRTAPNLLGRPSSPRHPRPRKRSPQYEVSAGRKKRTLWFYWGQGSKTGLQESIEAAETADVIVDLLPPCRLTPAQHGGYWTNSAGAPNHERGETNFGESTWPAKGPGRVGRFRKDSLHRGEKKRRIPRL